jgi:hypothetical protein
MIAQASNNSCPELLTSGASQNEIFDLRSTPGRLRVFFKVINPAQHRLPLACHD